MSDRHPVQTTLVVQWGDLDALGHVNNTHFFRWFESARIAYFEAVGLVTAGSPAVGPILAHTSCDFLAPVHFPATVRATAGVSKVGNTSFHMHYAAWVGDVQVARGAAVVVTVDYAEGKAVPVPAEVRARIEALQA